VTVDPTRLAKEDFPEQAEWIDRLLRPLNAFMQSTSGALSGGLDLSSAGGAEFRELTFETPSAGFGVVGATFQHAAGASINDSTYTIVDFATEVFDTHDAVTTGASWKFTAPVAGKYFVGAHVVYVGVADTWSTYLSLFKNGSGPTQTLCLSDQPTSLSQGTPGCVVVSLAKGDYFDLRTWQNSGAARSLSNDGTVNHVSVLLATPGEAVAVAPFPLYFTTRRKPRAVLVAQLEDTTANLAIAAASTPGWSVAADPGGFRVRVNHISGLQNSTKYRVVFLVTF
jgi:hypothetical protein